ncbi:MAG: PAS domain S-box protein, partial [Anaerolineae bacterium]|nr:PAS domain S-box protein [Anaerolineae bacterium]
SILGADGLIRYQSPSVERVLGHPPDEMIGKNVFDFIHPDDLEIARQSFEYGLNETNFGRSVEFRIRHRDGSWVYLEAVGHDLSDEPSINGLVVNSRNVTERKITEAELVAHRDRLEELVQDRTIELEHALHEVARAKEKMDAIVNSIAEGLIVTDLDRNIILANPAAEALLEMSIDDIRGQHIGFQIKNTELREALQTTLTHAEDSPEIDIELDTHPDESPKVLRAHSALVNSHEGQPLGIVTSIRDVTHEREVDRIKTEFLTTAAHELRTPLTTVQGFSEILLNRQLNQARQQRYLKMINQQATHVSEIVGSLLDVSRLESGLGLDINPEPVVLGQLLEDVILPFRETATNHKIRLENLAELPPIICDPFRIGQVFRNLLSNAIKYSPQGGLVLVRGQQLADALEISITDEGLGLTVGQQEHLFEKFYRAHSRITSISGTGLGLVICRLIIELHEGEIWVESEPNVGTTVFFRLPLKVPELESVM